MKNVNFDENSPEYSKEFDKKVSLVTFDFFKKNCFNAWKFKNIILACEEYVIHEYQRVNGELPSLDKVAEEFVALKKEAEKYHDELAEKVFWPLINAVLVIIYSSIAKKRSETYKDNIEASKKVIVGLEDEKNDNHGKIVMLEEIKSKIIRSSGMSPQKERKPENKNVDHDKADKGKSLDEYKEETDRIIEALKSIKNEQESDFYVYLKNIAKSLLHQKNMKMA